MEHINILSVRITAAIAIGFLYAITFTSINYDYCAPIDGSQGCATIEKAIMHPKDLLNNKQDSFVRLSKTSAVVSLGTFAVLSVLSLVNKKRLAIGK